MMLIRQSANLISSRVGQMLASTKKLSPEPTCNKLGTLDTKVSPGS